MRFVWGIASVWPALVCASITDSASGDAPAPAPAVAPAPAEISSQSTALPPAQVPSPVATIPSSIATVAPVSTPLAAAPQTSAPLQPSGPVNAVECESPMNFGSVTLGSTAILQANCRVNLPITRVSCATADRTFRCDNSALPPGGLSPGQTFTVPIAFDLTQTTAKDVALHASSNGGLTRPGFVSSVAIFATDTKNQQNSFPITVGGSPVSDIQSQNNAFLDTPEVSNSGTIVSGPGSANGPQPPPPSNNGGIPNNGNPSINNPGINNPGINNPGINNPGINSGFPNGGNLGGNGINGINGIPNNGIPNNGINGINGINGPNGIQGLGSPNGGAIVPINGINGINGINAANGEGVQIITIFTTETKSTTATTSTTRTTSTTATTSTTDTTSTTAYSTSSIIIGINGNGIRNGNRQFSTSTMIMTLTETATVMVPPTFTATDIGRPTLTVPTTAPDSIITPAPTTFVTVVSRA